MGTKKPGFIDFLIREIPLDMDASVKIYIAEKQKQTQRIMTKSEVYRNALELGLKSMGVIE